VEGKKDKSEDSKVIDHLKISLVRCLDISVEKYGENTYKRLIV